MSKNFQNILDRQEKEDRELIESEAEIIREMRAQLANCDEILALMHDYGYSGKEFFAAEDFPRVWPVVPVRFADEFAVHKHTVSSRPYFHDHTFYEIIYVHHGRCVQNFPDGRAPLVLKEKQLCLLRPGEVHIIESCGKSDVILKIVIPVDLFAAVTPKLGSAEKITVFAKTGEQTEWCVTKLLEESRRTDEYRTDAVRSYLSLLFVGLLRAPQNADEEFDEKIAEYLRENPQNATLAGFAATLGYSEGYAGRLVKEKRGRSFSEILGGFRLKKAAELLENTALPVEDVALQVGYQNASGLYKQFYGYYGMTPGDYRKMYR